MLLGFCFLDFVGLKQHEMLPVFSLFVVLGVCVSLTGCF